ncbi:hypothetical protein [Streptomyces sp. Da 82-17]|uniref:hypothetical protein n=1 Tax=Streptomyces sp. Da 82-17 TaxID=3377116 RepID=UPI0038D3979A
MSISSTGTILQLAAEIYSARGGHDGPHFASPDGHLDPVAAIYRATTGRTPWSLQHDDEAALLLLAYNEPAMDAIRWLSAVLPTLPPDTDGTPDHIEHVTHLASYAALGQPPARHNDVVGNLLRAAATADALDYVPAQRAAA